MPREQAHYCIVYSNLIIPPILHALPSPHAFTSRDADSRIHRPFSLLPVSPTAAPRYSKGCSQCRVRVPLILVVDFRVDCGQQSLWSILPYLLEFYSRTVDCTNCSASSLSKYGGCVGT